MGRQARQDCTKYVLLLADFQDSQPLVSASTKVLDDKGLFAGQNNHQGHCRLLYHPDPVPLAQMYVFSY